MTQQIIQHFSPPLNQYLDQLQVQIQQNPQTLQVKRLQSSIFIPVIFCYCAFVLVIKFSVNNTNKLNS